VGPGGLWRPREHASLLQVLLKPTLTFGKGRTRRSPIINGWGGERVVTRPGEGGPSAREWSI
jgi:hypothetical protein